MLENDKEANQKSRIAVIGNWHLAFVTAGSLIKLGHRVSLCDPEGKFSADRVPALPVSEPGLREILDDAYSTQTISFINNITDLNGFSYYWLAIDTPVDELDQADVVPLWDALEKLSKFAPKGSPLIINSQIPLTFCREVENRFGFKVAYIPENLRLGKGLDTFLHADRTVIGTRTSAFGEEIKKLLSGIETDFLLCDLETAEMVKHATNAFLATSISFANELAQIGEVYGVNSQLVGKALKLDKRIGAGAYVEPGLGFAGGTLPRDLRTLQKLGREGQRPTPLINSVLKVNEETTKAIVQIVNDFLGNFEKKKILLLGYTYKATTDTLRRSLTVELAEEFIEKKAEVWGFDPAMNGKDLSGFGSAFHHFNKWNEISECPDLVLVLTPRGEFRDLKWSMLSSLNDQGKYPTLVFDLRNCVNENEVLSAGLNFKSLWQPMVKSSRGVK